MIQKDSRSTRYDCVPSHWNRWESQFVLISSFSLSNQVSHYSIFRHSAKSQESVCTMLQINIPSELFMPSLSDVENDAPVNSHPQCTVLIFPRSSYPMNTVRPSDTCCHDRAYPNSSCLLFLMSKMMPQWAHTRSVLFWSSLRVHIQWTLAVRPSDTCCHDNQCYSRNSGRGTTKHQFLDNVQIHEL